MQVKTRAIASEIARAGEPARRRSAFGRCARQTCRRSDGKVRQDILSGVIEEATA
jgi:hypothetical protein